MNNKVEVVLDVDGVLADFEGFFCEMFGSNHRELVGLEKRYPEKKDAILKFVRNPNAYKMLDVLPLGKEIADWLVKQGITVHIVSSRPLGTFSVTQKWLKEKGIAYSSLTVKSDKVATIRSLQPALIVDDIISVVEECYRLSIPGILVKHPWNETPFFPRVENIQQFAVAFERVMDARPVHQWR